MARQFQGGRVYLDTTGKRQFEAGVVFVNEEVIVGTIAVTQTAATTASTGSQIFTGTSAVTQTSATTSATGSQIFTGTCAVTQTAATCASSGTVTAPVEVPATVSTLGGSGRIQKIRRPIPLAESLSGDHSFSAMVSEGALVLGQKLSGTSAIQIPIPTTGSMKQIVSVSGQITIRAPRLIGQLKKNNFKRDCAYIDSLIEAGII